MNYFPAILMVLAGLLPGVDAPYLRESGWRPLLNGRDMKGWHGRVCDIEPIDRGDRSPSCVKHYPFEWSSGASNPDKLSAVSTNGQSQDLLSDEKFGDVEVYLEFMLERGSNSGIYMQGHYEVQIFDSFAETKLVYGSSGGIYRGFSKPGSGKFAGSPPRVNAARPPGEWQSLQISFQAPRFDASGKKVANAKFIRVLLNGALIQENVEVDEPTISAQGTPEAPLGPLMLQGDHGPVAYRNIYVRPLR